MIQDLGIVEELQRPIIDESDDDVAEEGDVMAPLHRAYASSHNLKRTENDAQLATSKLSQWQNSLPADRFYSASSNGIILT